MLLIQMVATTTLPPRVEEVCLHKNHLTLMDYKIRVQVCYKKESLTTMEEATTATMKMKVPTTPPQRKARRDTPITQMPPIAKSLPWLHRTVVKTRLMKLLRKIKVDLAMMTLTARWEEATHPLTETPMVRTSVGKVATWATVATITMVATRTTSTSNTTTEVATEGATKAATKEAEAINKITTTLVAATTTAASTPVAVTKGVASAETASATTEGASVTEGVAGAL